MTIGFIGFGEASYLISKGLIQEEGLSQIAAYDVNATDLELGEVIRERADELKVVLTESLQELIETSHIIICATSANSAEPIAKNAKEFMTPDHLYVDINAASSKVKERVANYILEVGAKFVDGAVMGSIPLKKHKTPIYISGNGAKAFKDLGEQYSMDLSFISEKPGASSAIKMFRSIFMKGLATLLWETLESSHRYGVTDQVMHSLDESLLNMSIEKLADTLIPRTALHAKRRVAEMDEVIKTLQELNVDETLSTAVQHKLRKIENLNLNKEFNYKAPSRFSEVLNILTTDNEVKR